MAFQLATPPAITSIDDVVAIEQRPYRESVPISMIGDLVDSFRTHGDRVAISFMPSGDPNEPTQDITFRELHRKVVQAANAFHALGVGPDDAVAYLLPSVPEGFITLLGAELAGRACPINYMLSASAITEIIVAARAKVLVVFGPDPDVDIWPKVDDIRQMAPSLRQVLVLGHEVSTSGCMSFDALIGSMSGELNFAREINPDTIAAIYHTGGSTGAPKLVQHTHGNQIHCLWFVRQFFGFNADDVVINGHPLFHVAGALSCGTGPLAAGARLLMPSKFGMRNRTFQANVWRAVERHKATVTIGGPTVITMLLGLDSGPFDISSMRLHISGGAPLPPELVGRMHSKFGIPVKNSWGMTETGGLLTLEPALALSVGGSCGWRMPYTRITALALSAEGTNQAAICKPGEVGVLAVKGPHVTPGYLDDAHNATSFTPDGWFLTGDLGWIDTDHRVYLTGRAKDIIIRGGHNIDPLVIEQALLTHPDVQLCAAVGQPDSHSGEIPVAFVQLTPGATIELDDLVDAVRPSFSEPAAIPKRLYRVDGFPMTSTGKILKPALRRKAAEAAVIEKLRDIVPGGTELHVSVHETRQQDIMHIELPHDAGEDLIEKVGEAITSLRLPFKISLAETVTSRPT